MTRTPPVDRELVQRVNDIHVDFQVKRIESYQARPNNPAGIRVERFGRATATLFPRVPVFNRVYDFDDSSVPFIQKMIAFYGDHRTGFDVSVSPIALSEEVSMALGGAGLRAHRYYAFSYGNPEDCLGDMKVSGMEVFDVGPDELDSFMETYLEGFGTNPESWPAAKENMVRLSSIPGLHLLLARSKGEPTSIAMLYVKDRVAYLAAGASRPAHRELGAHLGLIRHRCQMARDMQCDLVVGCAEFGSGSFRNMQRAGLRIAYTEASWLYRPA